MNRTPNTQPTWRLGRAGLMALLIGLLLLAGCTTIPNMKEQPKLDKPYGESELFESAAHELDPNAVPQGYLYEDTALYTGMQNGVLVEEIPLPVTEELLQEGQRQFEVFCTPCHGYAGYGDGVLVEEGFPPPPSYHTDAVRQLSVGHYFDVITNGQVAMFSYASRVQPEDRWAIVAYIRALQLSQNTSLADLPAEAQDAFNAAVLAEQAAGTDSIMEADAPSAEQN